MADKVYIVTDLGPGDGGKGGIVEAVARKVKARLVIKEGGAQGSHGVVLRDGRQFCFSQWGCATFQGVPSYLSERFVFSPTGLLNEAEALQQCGVSQPFELLSADANCVCATPYHQVWSKLYEISLRGHPHGTVGTGVGKAYQFANTHPELTLHANMLQNSEQIRHALIGQRDYVRSLFGGLTADDVLAQDVPYLQSNLSALNNDAAIDDITDLFCHVGNLLRLEDMREILKPDGKLVVERSHGVLTDSECGLQPHVSSLRTLPIFTMQSLGLHGFSGRFVNLGVHRAYEVRHGAGPMPSSDEELRAHLLPGSHKDSNRWQGDVRVGALDLVLLSYALDLCGGAQNFDGLCLTWFDQILKSNSWPICTGYSLKGQTILPHTKVTTQMLEMAEPIVDQLDICKCIVMNDRGAQFDFCKDVLHDLVKVPVRLISFGPCAEDKVFK